MIAEMKRCDPRILVITLSDSSQAFEDITCIDECIDTAEQLSFELDFSDVPPPLRRFVGVIVGIPLPDRVVEGYDFERSQTELQRFKRQIDLNGRQSRVVVLSRVAEGIRASLRADGVAIAFGDPLGLVCQASAGTAPSPGSHLRSGSVLAKECFETGQALLCEDAERDVRVNRFLAREMGYRSLAVVPIYGRRSILGVVHIFSSRPFAFSASHVVRVSRIARLLVPFAEEGAQRNRLLSFPPVAVDQSKRKPTLVAAREFPERTHGVTSSGRVWAGVAAVSSAAVLGFFFVLFGFQYKPQDSAKSYSPVPRASASLRKPASGEAEAGDARIDDMGLPPLSLPEKPPTFRPRIDLRDERRASSQTEPTNLPAKTGRQQIESRVQATNAEQLRSAPLLPPNLPIQGFSAGAKAIAELPDAISKPELEESPEIEAAIRPRPKPEEPTPPGFVLDHTFKGHSSWVTGVVFSPDQRRLVSGSWDHKLKFWDVSTGQELGSASGEVDRVQAITLSPNGRWLAAESDSNSVMLFNASTGQAVRTLRGRKNSSPFSSNWVYSIAFSPDSRWLASAVDNKTVRLWDVQTGRAMRDYSGSSRSVIYIAFSPDGRLLASGMDDKKIGIWDTGSGRVTQILNNRSSVYAVAFSPDGRWLASAGGDNKVKLWELTTGRQVHSLAGHRARVTTLGFSPDSRWLASGSWDKTIKLWDVGSGREVDTLSGNTHDIYTIAFDGTRLASGSEDGTIRIWRLEYASTEAKLSDKGNASGSTD
jgi:WD40 repeat protein